MRRFTIGAVAVAGAGLLAAGALASPVLASPATGRSITAHKAAPKARAHAKDDLPSPMSDKRRALMRAAADKQIKGQVTPKAIGKSKVVKLGKRADGKSQYVETSTTRTDQIFTILVNFGDKTDPRAGGAAGPVNNQIAEPDRNWDGSATDDNSTYWAPNFNRQHYLNMFFGKRRVVPGLLPARSPVASYTVAGDVSDWVTVPYNEARYGSNDDPRSPTATGTSSGTRRTSWYAAADRGRARPRQQIHELPAQFDNWDRYDFDGDGNFNEPDGYLDHFQVVHAGEGEEAGGGAEGADAIWSHRWYAFSTARARPARPATCGWVPVRRHRHLGR